MVLGHNLNDGQRTQDVRISEDVSFDTMLLRNATLKGLKNAGFLKPSPIQLHGIPLGKCGFDLLLEAKSGTGKTAVFTVIALEKLELNKGVQTIVLAPTREIASQITGVITDVGSHYKGLKVAVVMGGLPVKDDKEKFKENVHIVVGSPGRLRHLIHDDNIDVSSVRLFILDEADKLLENSFLTDINYIFSRLPKQKQVIMSSATYPEETRLFISKYVQKVQHICPDSNSVLLGIEQKVVIVPYHSNIVKQTKHRYDELKKILNGKQFKQCLVFCNYQVRVGELHRMLSRDKWPAEQLYGQQEQTDRLDALKTLQEYKCRILVSTDLAARGIDASNVDVIINFEPPLDWQTYLHRIGRAGRYGSYGTAISILSEGKEKNKFKEILIVTNMQFNIRDFWNDEPFNLSLNITNEGCLKRNQTPGTVSPEISTVNENKNEDLLWKVLTTESFGKNNDEELEITSFKGLCDSFKISSEPSIETFSKLMDSFTVNQNKVLKNMDSFKYKHVTVAKLPIDNYKYCNNYGANNINEIYDHPNGDTPGNKTENKPKFEGDKIINRDSVNEKGMMSAQKENKTHLSESMDNGSKVLSDCIENTFEDNILENSQKEVDKVNLQECDTKKSLYATKIDLIEQALIEVGLPTAFGKPKAKKNDCYKTNNSCFSNTNKENAKIEKHKVTHEPFNAQHNNSKVIKNIKSYRTTNIKKEYQNNCSLINIDKSDHSKPSSGTDENSDKSESSTETSNDKRTNTKARNNLSDYTKYAPSAYNNAYCNCKRFNNSNQVQNRSKQFDLWYNQLKHQVQYIQYALYIEELRNL